MDVARVVKEDEEQDDEGTGAEVVAEGRDQREMELEE